VLAFTRAAEDRSPDGALIVATSTGAIAELAAFGPRQIAFTFGVEF
jgi:hypothetical protein